MPSDIMQDLSSPLGANSPESVGMDHTAVECMYRVNVGGPLVAPINDSSGLYRTWQSNESFLFSTSSGVENVSTSRQAIVYPAPLPSYIAPPVVYSTALQMSTLLASGDSFNISWLFTTLASFI